MWSWDVTYLPTTVRRIWPYPYLVVDVWSHKVVAWDVDKREDPAIAADLVSRACLRERFTMTRKQTLASMPKTGMPCVQPGCKAGWRTRAHRSI